VFVSDLTLANVGWRNCFKEHWGLPSNPSSGTLKSWAAKEAWATGLCAWEAEAGGCWVRVLPRLHSETLPQKKRIVFGALYVWLALLLLLAPEIQFFMSLHKHPVPGQTENGATLCWASVTLEYVSCTEGRKVSQPWSIGAIPLFAEKAAPKSCLLSHFPDEANKGQLCRLYAMIKVTLSHHTNVEPRLTHFCVVKSPVSPFSV
jgi:hypothetical protein